MNNPPTNPEAPFFRECARVIKSDGYVLYDLPISNSGGAFESVRWQRESDMFRMMLTIFSEVVRVEQHEGSKWVLLRGKATPTPTPGNHQPSTTPGGALPPGSTKNEERRPLSEPHASS